MAKFGGQLASWCITLVVIRLLVPGDYGLMAMATVIMGLLTMIAEMGFGASLVQAVRFDVEGLRRLSGATLLINLAFMGVLFAAAPLVAHLYAEPRLAAVIHVTCLQFALNAFAVIPDALLRRAMRFRALSLIEIGSGLAGNASTLALALTGHGVWSLVFGALVTTAVRTGVLQLMHPLRATPRFSWVGALGMVRFGAGVTTTRIFSYFSNQADMLVGGRLLGREALGIYSVALHLATLPMQRVSSVINDVAFAAFAQIQADSAGVSRNLLLAIRLLAFLSFPTLWGIAAVTPEIVGLALGERWSDVVTPMQIIALAVPLRMVGTILATCRLSVGRVDLSTWTALVALIITPLVYIVAVRWGVLGLALAWAGLSPLHFVLCAWGSRTSLATRWAQILAAAAPSALAAGIMLFVVLVARSAVDAWPVLAQLCVLALLGAAVYVLASLLLNRRTFREAMELLRPGHSAKASL